MIKGRQTAKTNPPFPKIGPDDVYMLSYTSGTTGDPKGVMVTNKTSIISCYAVNIRLGT